LFGAPQVSACGYLDRAHTAADVNGMKTGFRPCGVTTF